MYKAFKFGGFLLKIIICQLEVLKVLNAVSSV